METKLKEEYELIFNENRRQMKAIKDRMNKPVQRIDVVDEVVLRITDEQAEQLQKELLRIGFERVEPNTDNLKSNEVIKWDDLPSER